MNILFLEGDMSRRGGTERMTAVLSKALYEKENRIFILSLTLKEQEVFFPLIPQVTHIALNSSDEKRGMPRQIGDIHKFIRQKKIDIVINVDIGMGIYGIIASIGTKAKVITWEHANYFNNWGSKIFPYLRKFATKYSHALVVLTQKDQQNYRGHIRTKTPIYVIPNPVEKHGFTYDVHSKTILSAGLLLPIKGYEKVVQIAHRVFNRYPDWKWIICGEGPERGHLEQLIKEYQLKDKIILAGTVQDMDTQYQKAAMFIMTSQMEGLPMVLLEAKSWGLPLVSFDIMTGPSDIIRDGIDGYLIEAGNVDEMAKRIEELIEDESKRIEFSRASQEDINIFGMGRIVGKWKRIIRDLIEK